VGYFAELQLADARLGGKARSLAELSSAGLPTPAGFVILDDLFRSMCPEVPPIERIDEAVLSTLLDLRARLVRSPWPAGFREELRQRQAALGAGRFAVRSSFASEDRPGRLAAGVYESRVDLAASDVERAIRDVLGSALAPGAVAYALACGEAPVGAPLAVLVHVFVAGIAEGSAAFDHGRMLEPMVTFRRGQLLAQTRAGLCRDLVALAACRGPIEIEWVCSQGRIVYLQARPFVAPGPVPPWTGWADLTEGEAHESWRWDMAHNPLPLSPAQAGLVALVDGKCAIGVRQRVISGYLFHAGDDRPLPPALACEQAEPYFSRLREEVEARLDAIGPAPALEDALSLFLFAYEPIFGVLQPALRRARVRLTDFLDAHAPDAGSLLPVLLAQVPSVASERLGRAGRIAAASTREARARAIADYVAYFGDESAAWDVCAPTYAEDPGALADLRACKAADANWRPASDVVEAMLAPDRRGEWRGHLSVARAAVSLGEADDWLYARVQGAVRRALLGLGRRLCAEGGLGDVSDIFYLPFALSRGLANGNASASDLVSLAAAGRKLWEAAKRDPPPLPYEVEAKAVRGAGTGGRALGRVVWHWPGSPGAFGQEAVLVARTLLPTELPLLHAIAIVTETGAPLDHVSTQARERGIPAVVGASGASAALTDGDLVLVDGDRGLVVRLKRAGF
jgi:phosphohistidine swiveling domain-containing protein